MGKLQEWVIRNRAHLAFLSAIGAMAVASLFIYYLFGKDISPLARWQANEEIYVDSPEIYTRERLINERLEEETWLEKELGDSRSYTPTILRSEVVRFRGGLFFGQEEAGTQPEAQALQPRAPANRPEEMPKKEAEDSNAPPAIGQQGIVDESGEDGKETAQPPTAIQEPPTPAPGKLEAPQVTEKEKPEEASAPAMLALPADQVFKIRSAYRSLIRQRLIENRLDDRHDLLGNSLYILKFDTTVFSVPALKRQAKVTVRLLPIKENSDFDLTKSSTYDAFSVLFERWLADLERRLNAVAKAEVEKLRSGGLSEAAAAQLYPFLARKLPAIRSKCGQHFLDASADQATMEGDHKLQVAGSGARCIAMILVGTPEFYKASEALVYRSIVSILGVSEDDLELLSFSYGKYKVSFRNRPPPVRISFKLDPNGIYLPQINVTEATADFQYLDGCKSGMRERLELLSERLEGVDPISLRKTFSDLVKPALEKASEGIQHSSFVAHNMKAGLDAGVIVNDGLSPEECPIEYRGLIRVGLTRFIQEVEKFSTYSYSVLPRESAVAVKNEIRRELSAGANKGGWLDYDISGEDEVSGHSLMPVLSTFSDTEDLPPKTSTPRVGWIIAPAVLYGGGVNSLSSLSESVMAIVSVPAWWSKLRLDLTTTWIDEMGQPIGTEKTKQMEVSLPNNFALVDTLVFQKLARGPVITDIVVTDGKDECESETSVLIIGQRLWRNTSVTVGGIKADKIAVMPDMSAVLATFSTREPKLIRGKLIVWTSEGFADAPGIHTMRASDPVCGPDERG